MTAALVGLVMLLGAAVRAEEVTAACESPFVFPNVAANIAPVEFLATVADVRTADLARLERLQRTARRLAWLLKLDSWHQPTYGSLGAVAHLFLNRKCPADDILDTMIQGSGSGPIEPEQILVLVDGRIFVEGEQILLQSRVRGFRRNGVGYHGPPLTQYMQPEALEPSLAGGQALRSQMPALDVTFAPRVLTQSELDEIDKRFERATRLYQSPSIASHSDALHFEAHQQQTFWAEIRDGEWLEVRDVFSNRSGFIRADPGVSEFLHDRLPELDFLNGVLGYLRLVQAQRRGPNYPPPPHDAAEHATASLRSFLRRERTKSEREAQALANALIGAIAVSQKPNWTAARSDFQEAVRLAPYVSIYRNMLGVANAVLCCGDQPAGEFGDPAVEFTESLSLDPANLDALKNLSAFLTVLGELEARGLYPKEVNFSRIAERRRAVDEVLASTRSEPIPVATNWVGIAVSTNGRVFFQSTGDSEMMTRYSVKSDCENTVGRTCQAIAIPSGWDAIALTCRGHGRMGGYVGGSGTGNAESVAYDRARQAGFEPSECTRVYSY